MIRSSQILIAAALLAGCTPATPAAPVADEPAAAVAAATPPPQPRESIAETYGATCTWGEVVSAGIAIWSYTCPTVRLVADEALPGFLRETTEVDGTTVREPMIIFFAKAPDAPIGAVIDAVRAASPGSESCEIEPGSHDDFVLMPTGDQALAYSRFLNGEAEEPSMPCGPLGPSEAGGRTFRVLDGAPDKVIMIDWGTEPPVYDPDTLQAVS